METIFNLQNLDVGINFNKRSLVVNASDKTKALQILRSRYFDLITWTLRLGLNVTIIKYPGCDRPFRIPASFLHKGDESFMTTNLVQTPLGIQLPDVRLSLPLLRVLMEFAENPDMSAGLVRLSDERQICVTEASAQLVPNNDVEQLVRLRRQDYWWLADLESFNQEWRQRLEPNNPQSFFEYSYRSEADSLGSWGRFTTRYRVIQDDQGILYHVCYSVGFEPIAALR
ncbi:hypothetical protein BLD44_007180 [Mastigocladus laminosus UU774]|nr:hypothetical protein BLD44_007180 [Mastigocladus laminosus UU774]